MEKTEIGLRLLNCHQEFVDFLKGLPKEKFEFQFQDKWTAGQQLEHILLSVDRLKKALSIPGFFLKYKFGIANRPSRTYDELVNRYNERLNTGGVAPSAFLPNKIDFNKRNSLTSDLMKIVKKLSSKVNRFSEKDLDLIIVPHPLLGKVTLREVYYFTIYHAEHHMRITKRNLETFQ